MNIVNGDSRRGLLPAALILGLCLMAAAWIGGRAFLAARMAGDGLTVKGTAEAKATSTLAVWRGSVSARSADPAGATRELEQQAQRVATWLESQGVKPAEWEWLPLQSYVIYRTTAGGNATSEVEAYQLERPLKLQSSRVKEIARLARETEGLLREGVTWSGAPPEFYLGDLEKVKLELLGRAATDARRRAEVLLGGGKRLGGLVSARQGILQVTQPNSVEVEDYGMYSTETIEKVVKAVVTVTFALRP
ncbi:MAG: SIMPL domain-containing protein [Candidatus Delongbacteria bacterium]